MLQGLHHQIVWYHPPLQCSPWHCQCTSFCCSGQTAAGSSEEYSGSLSSPGAAACLDPDLGGKCLLYWHRTAVVGVVVAAVDEAGAVEVADAGAGRNGAAGPAQEPG